MPLENVVISRQEFRPPTTKNKIFNVYLATSAIDCCLEVKEKSHNRNLHVPFSLAALSTEDRSPCVTSFNKKCFCVHDHMPSQSFSFFRFLVVCSLIVLIIK